MASGLTAMTFVQERKEGLFERTFIAGNYVIYAFVLEVRRSYHHNLLIGCILILIINFLRIARSKHLCIYTRVWSISCFGVTAPLTFRGCWFSWHLALLGSTPDLIRNNCPLCGAILV